MMLLMSFISALLLFDSVNSSCLPGDPTCLDFSPSPSPNSGSDDTEPPVSIRKTLFPPYSPSNSPSPSSDEPSSSSPTPKANSPESYSSPAEQPASQAYAPASTPSYDDDTIPADAEFPRSTLGIISQSLKPDLGAAVGAAGASKPVDPSIKKICDTTLHADLCLSSITPFLSSTGGQTDTISILEMEIKAAVEATNLVQSAAEQAINSPTTSAAVKSALTDCGDMYQSVTGNLQDAREAMLRRDVGTMNSMLSAVVADIGTCTDGFVGSSSPLGALHDRVIQLASNCLAIVRLIN